jgi:hypothetical protein
MTMIKIAVVSGNFVRIKAPEKLKADDFREITPQVDSILARHGKIRLMVDFSAFKGWENMEAFENHISFIKNHYQKIDRIAVVVGHEWQRWLAGAIKVFLHLNMRVFDKKHEDEALRWIAT